MDSSRRTPVDGSVDRLAALRAASTAPVAAPRLVANTRVLLLAGIMGFLAVFGVVVMRVVAPDGAPTSGDAETPTAVTPAEETELLAGEALMAFPVKEGHYPPALGRGDVIRVVVTPAADGSGETKLINESVVVSEVDEMSDMSSDVVVTVRGRETLLGLIASSGPIHVALVHAPGDPE